MLARIVLFVAAMALPISAQVGEKVSDSAPKAASTRFEAFTSTNGRLMIREFYDVASPKLMFGSAETRVIRVTDTSSGESVLAVRVSYTGEGKYDRATSAILDQDEVGALANAADYMLKNESKIVAEATACTEVTFTSRSGFQAGFYTQPGTNKSACYLRVGAETVFLTNLSDLATFVEAIQAQIKALAR